MTGTLNPSPAAPPINGLRMQGTKSAAKIKKKSAGKKKLPNRQQCASKFTGLAERVLLVLKVTACRQWRALQL